MKICLNDLALMGGSPAFDEKLHVGRPNVGDRNRLLGRIEDILDRRWFTNRGPYVQEFEQKIAEMLGVKHCIAVCNATVGLEITIRAAGLTGEVIVPSFTFVATAHALQWQEITPVFADIDPETHHLDPAAVRRMITPRTSGIIGVHLWGRPCAVDALAEIAEEHGLTLLFDAAHAFGCSHRDHMIGNFGLAEVFSFHATKFLNTFEGGAIVTNNDDLATQIRLMTNFGFVDYDEVIYVGTNGKMTELSAAMGLTGLESLDTFVRINRQNYEAYRSALSNLRGLRLISYDESNKCNFQYIIVEVDEDACGLNRNEMVQLLFSENVLARRYFYPGCHQMEPYRSYFPHAGLVLPNTKAIANRVLALPTGTAIDPSQIREICAILRIALQNPDCIRRRLAEGSKESSSAVADPVKIGG